MKGNIAWKTMSLHLFHSIFCVKFQTDRGFDPAVFEKQMSVMRGQVQYVCMDSMCECMFGIGVASESFCLNEHFIARFLWQPSHVYFYNKVSLRMFGDKLSIIGLYTCKCLRCS